MHIQITGTNPIYTCRAHCLFAPFLGQTVHTGGKPRAVFQGGDARWCTSRADIPPTVRPEEEKGVGPAL